MNVKEDRITEQTPSFKPPSTPYKHEQVHTQTNTGVHTVTHTHKHLYHALWGVDHMVDTGIE